MLMNIKKTIAILMVLVFLCSGSSVFAKDSVKQKYNGETLFRGLVFGQGPVAKVFNEIWTKDLLKELSNKDTVAIVDDIINKMKVKDSTFFKQFEQAVYSGDHLQVSAAIKKGGEILQQILTDGKFANNDPGTGQGSCYVAYLALAVGLVAVYSHAAILTAGGGITVYFVIVAGLWFWAGSASADDAALKQEMIIDLVVTKFAN